ncbi:MAG: metalloregulator ArsR/SmtB family transcription factor [Acetobacteraceae bacterium]|nr:metalloregulator ArsR/SmtB family transcription factor [Acetobacteraceae bacterium]
MDRLLASLRATAEPTRFRLLALAASGAFCVSEYCEILGQSQPRVSRHLKLLCDAGLLERSREGPNVWFTVPEDEAGAIARALVALLSSDDPILAADRRQAARVLSERARIASDSLKRRRADWDEMRALGLPADLIETSVLALLPAKFDRLLDIGTGTGRLLELLAPRARSALGIDASAAMLALARARLARAELPHCTVRQGDMYRLPIVAGCMDLAVLQMVLHYAEDPQAVLAEAARVLRPGGLLLVIDLAAHSRDDLTRSFAHRWPGFSPDAMHRLLVGAGAEPGLMHTIPGSLTVCLWPARRLADASAAQLHQLTA